MFTVLLHKKSHKRLSSNKRAFSSIIGAIFAALVIISLTSGLFVWSLSQDALYNNAVRQKNQLDAERLAENLKAYGANYTVSSSSVSVNALIQNQGSLPVEFIRLWLVDSNNGLYGSYPLNLNLKAGQIQSVVAVVPIDGVGPQDNLSSWLVTERGNMVSTMQNGGGPPGPAGTVGPQGPEGPSAVNALTAQGLGSVAMDFNSFKYYVVNSSKLPARLMSYPTGQSGYSAPGGTKSVIGFAVNITNYDMSHRTLTFTSTTMMWVLFPVLGNQPRSAWWYIVNVDSNGNISPTYTPITLNFNQTKTIVFASLNEMVNVNSFAGATPGFSGPSVANLMIVGKAGSDPLGNNIPFVAIQFS